MTRQEAERKALRLSNKLPQFEDDFFDELFDEMDMNIIDEISYNGSYGVHESYVHLHDCYYTKVQAFKGYNVVRMIKVECRKRYLGSFPNCRFEEVFQQWFIDGEIVTIARDRRNKMCDLWNFGTPMKVRHEDYNYIYANNCDSIYDGKEIMEIGSLIGKTKGQVYQHLKGNMTGKHYCGTNKVDMLFSISPIGEYLHACKYDRFIGYMNRTKRELIEKYIDSLKIAHRHKYHFTKKNFAQWFDYVDTLNLLHKDIKNPIYICPNDLNEAHRQAQARYAEIQARIKAEKQSKVMVEELTKAKALNQAYEQLHGTLFGVCFASKDSKINIRVLNSVEEIYLEAQAFGNCMYSRRYFEKEDSICMVATNENGKRIACIEFDLNTREVIQLLGIGNNELKECRSKRIEKLIMDNECLLAS